jgi:hypothetical protein
MLPNTEQAAPSSVLFVFHPETCEQQNEPPSHAAGRIRGDEAFAVAANMIVKWRPSVGAAR